MAHDRRPVFTDIVRDPVAMTITVLGFVVMILGLILLADSMTIGWLLLFAAMVLVFGASYIHDRSHRRRGEQPHAIWGRGDGRRPGWLGGPRR